VTIAGLSEAIIPVKIPWHFQKRTSLLRSAVPLGYNGVAGVKCIVKANTGPAPYILNLLAKPCTLKRGSVIAIISPLQIEAATELAAPAETVFSADVPNNQDLEFQRVALADIEIDLQQDKLSDAEFKTLTNLIYHNKDIFAVKTSDLTGALVPPMVIDTGNHAPIRQRNYRHSPAVIKEMERQVTELLDAGIVSESASPWCSPTLMVKKAGTTELRLVQDLRKLNSITKPLYQPVPMFSLHTTSYEGLTVTTAINGFLSTIFDLRQWLTLTLKYTFWSFEVVFEVLCYFVVIVVSFRRYSAMWMEICNLQLFRYFVFSDITMV